ncbi:MAG: hypothetical protein EOO20_00695 [Chryseobacterium sp.]|jgi:uncharacterized protein YdaT|nr:MAG: hypothetical protein EOO20_00695 [Chryseobacterium sp.]
MPWHNGDYPPSYKNQPIAVRQKAVEIANALLRDGAEEGTAIATGLYQARLLLENHSDQHALEPSDLYENQVKNHDTAQDGHSSDAEDTVRASKK